MRVRESLYQLLRVLLLCMCPIPLDFIYACVWILLLVYWVLSVLLVGGRLVQICLSDCYEVREVRKI